MTMPPPPLPSTAHMPPPPLPKPESRGRVVLMVLAIMLGGLALLSVVVFLLPQRPPPPPPGSPTASISAKPPPPPAAVQYFDAPDLAKSYAENEVRGDADLKGKWVEVTGRVERVGRDLLGTGYVMLSGGQGSARQIQCLFSKANESQLEELSKGDRVVVLGKVKGLMMNVLVEDCSLPRRHPAPATAP